MIVKVEHPVAGTYQMAGSPLKFSSLTEAHYEPAPTLGQHTREILSERLNMTDTEIEALLKRTGIYAITPYSINLHKLSVYLNYFFNKRYNVNNYIINCYVLHNKNKII